MDYQDFEIRAKSTQKCDAFEQFQFSVLNPSCAACGDLISQFIEIVVDRQPF